MSKKNKTTAATGVDNFCRYLMSSLGLDPYTNLTAQPVVLQLYEIENALSNLLAMVFWIGKCCVCSR
jgi:hypothetical protein